MWRYVLRGIVFYRGVNLAVMLAVGVATAVIAGALIVGDSVRSSLRDMSMQRLGGITHALHAPGFFTQKLGERLPASIESLEDGEVCAPALLMNASLEARSTGESVRRAGSVILLATNASGWSLLDTGGVSAPSERGVVLGHRTAHDLNVRAGDVVSLWVELPSSIPRDSLLGERDELVRELELTVDAVLSETDGGSRFSLNPSQQLPQNAFVSLSTLQERLALDELVATRRNPVSRPARVNTLLIGRPLSAETNGTITAREIAESDRQLLTDLSEGLKKTLQLDDFGLRLRPIVERGYLSAESDSMILQNAVVEAVRAAADRLGISAHPAQVYLANEIRAADAASDDQRYSMYSIVAGVDFDQKPPLGPFTLADGGAAPALAADEILLSQWLATDLQVSAGNTIQMRWHEVGSHGDLPEISRSFTVRGVLAADNSASMDPDLTPFVDGVTNVDSFGDWDQPFEMEMGRITDRDDEYWSLYRATPKAFVSRETADALWSSRFGRYTSVRLASEGVILPVARLDELRDRLAQEIPARLRPQELGLAFQPVRLMGLQAAVGANDFSGLFLGFSSFLILSAVLLAALMFQLGIQRRVTQVGLLEAIGFTRWSTRRVFLGEGVTVALLGAVLGAVGGVWFAQLMILGLTTWWVGAVGTQFLRLDVQPLKLVVAAGTSVVLAVGVILFALLQQTRRSPRELLSGEISDVPVPATQARWRWIRRCSMALAVICAFGLPAATWAGLVPATEAMFGYSWQVAAFFMAGCGALALGLLLLSGQLRRRVGDTIESSGRGGILRLAIANASRNASRSLLTTALIAFATFVIVAVAAARRNPISETPDVNSGNGGFALVAESAQPVLFDLNTSDGRQRLGIDRSESTTVPPDVRVFGFTVKPGEDASCLNLYQPTVPTLLGASDEFLRRGGFRFANTPGENPWLLLDEPLADVDGLPAIPVIGDMNTLQYSLKKGIGDVVLFPSVTEPQFALQIVGMLDSSIFQGVLVLSDSDLKRVAPEVSGTAWFLIETAAASANGQTASALETALDVYGFDTESVSERLAGFLAVQNTYLSTFQMLGGLGLLVGTIGLAAVMLRNVLERRSEIALMLAIGFTRARVVGLIFVENSILLFWGITTGTGAALIAILPHLLSTGADMSWTLLGMTLGAVAAVGSLAVVLPIGAATRTSIREGLTR